MIGIADVSSSCVRPSDNASGKAVSARKEAFVPQTFSPLQRLSALARYGFPFAWGKPPSRIVQLRRHNLRERFRSRSAVQRIALYLFCSLAYPIFTAIEVRRNLALLRRTHPAAGPLAAWRMFLLAIKGNVPPFSYVFYEFEDPSRRALWPEYLYWTDRDALKMLNRLRGANPLDVQDKVRFAQICKEHLLPHAEAIAVFRPGNPAALALDDLEDGAELWIKPIDLQASVGAECWSFADGLFASNDGRHFSSEEFLAYLRARTCLVQRRLKNHTAIDPITNGWLATLRIVVALRGDGTAALLGTALALPRGHFITSSSAFICAVGWDDGTIFQVQDPTLPGRAAPPDLRHSDTGQVLCGHTVPFWRESLELVQRAHRTAFPCFATLGWDVAITPDGPLLLETNSGWGDQQLQAVFGPLGKTVLTEIISEELPR